MNDKDKSQRQFKYPFKKQQPQLKVQPIPSPPLSVVNKGSLILQSSGSPKVLKNSLCQPSFRAAGVAPIVTQNTRQSVQQKVGNGRNIAQEGGTETRILNTRNNYLSFSSSRAFFTLWECSMVSCLILLISRLISRSFVLK